MSSFKILTNEAESVKCGGITFYRLDIEMACIQCSQLSTVSLLKRYSDFYTLRKKLRKKGYTFPNFPDKYFGSSLFASQTNIRKSQLVSWLREALCSNSDLVIDEMSQFVTYSFNCPECSTLNECQPVYGGEEVLNEQGDEEDDGSSAKGTKDNIIDMLTDEINNTIFRDVAIDQTTVQSIVKKAKELMTQIRPDVEFEREASTSTSTHMDDYTVVLSNLESKRGSSRQKEIVGELSKKEFPRFSLDTKRYRYGSDEGTGLLCMARLTQCIDTEYSKFKKITDTLISH